MPKKLLVGVNDLASQNTSILTQWDYELNTPLTPSEVSYSSTKIVWWKCEYGHRWQDSVDKRFRSAGQCPICNKQRVIKGVNDFASRYPDILDTWDYARNKEDPCTLSLSSAKSVNWICSKGHSWKTSVAQRIKQNGCPYCRGKKIWPGFNDFATLFPQLLQEWDFELNTASPNEIAPANSKKYHWVCPQGHKYEAAIASRTRLGSGCPYCSGQKAISGYNDLASQYPELMKEWDFAKNTHLNPNEVICGSEKKAWWICKNGHSWETMIITRAEGCGCPICAKEYKTSIPEQALFFYCLQFFPDAINNYHTDWLGRSEIDVYIPSLGIGIEYDGRAWHKKTSNDIEKNRICIDHGIRIIRLREPGISCFDSDCIMLDSLKTEDLSRGIIAVLNLVGITNCDVDVDRDVDKIYQLMNYKEKQLSLFSNYPEIASEWDHNKNGKYISPSTVNCKSGKEVYWICSKGHSYKARIDHRTIMKSGCPYCSGKRVLKGETDLASLYPHIAAEWDYDSNQLMPNDYHVGSNYKACWKCEKGHKWKATIQQRTRLGSSCPYCAGQKAISGVTDVKTVDPALIEEWDYEKNGAVLPEYLLPKSHVLVWWKCKRGHSWQDTVRNRHISKKRECPICKQQKLQ